MDNESKKTTTVSYAIIAIVAALALPGIVEITVGGYYSTTTRSRS